MSSLHLEFLVCAAADMNRVGGRMILIAASPEFDWEYAVDGNSEIMLSLVSLRPPYPVVGELRRRKTKTPLLSSLVIHVHTSLCKPTVFTLVGSIDDL
jgi:hypothetical protein